MNVYNTNTGSRRVNAFSRNQLRLSSIAYLTTGIGLLVIFGLSFIFAEVFQNVSGETKSILTTTATIGILVSIILSIVWQFRIMKASMIFKLLTIGLYCVSNGIGFGSLFVVIDFNELVAGFALTAVVCVICFIVSRFMTEKMAINLQKMMMIMTVIYFILAIGTLFVWIFGFNQTGNILNVVIGIVFSVVLLGAIAFQFWNINKMDEFIDDKEQSLAFGMFLGFMLLMMIVQLAYRLIYLIRYIGN